MAVLSSSLLSLAQWIRRNGFQWTRRSTLSTFVLGAAFSPFALFALNQARLQDIEKRMQEAAGQVRMSVQADADAGMQNRSQADSLKTPVGPDPAVDTLEKMLAATSPANEESSPGRRDFRLALLATSSDSLARRLYQRVDGDGVRLRSGPSETTAVLRRIERASYVKLEAQFAEGNWCHVRLAEGREGWVKCDFLRPIVPAYPPRWE
jgi:hypothetical protein